MLSVISSRLPSTSSAFSSEKRTFPNSSSLDRCPAWRRPSSLDKEESQVEIDRDKALEALQKLDQQLQYLARKEVVPKKKPISSYSSIDANNDVRMRMRREELPEVSGSFLAFAAGFLFILTIVNNLIFNLYVKPSVDGRDQQQQLVSTSTVQKTALSQPSSELSLL